MESFVSASTVWRRWLRVWRDGGYEFDAVRVRWRRGGDLSAKSRSVTTAIVLLIALAAQVFGWWALSRGMPYLGWGSWATWSPKLPIVLRQANIAARDGTVWSELLRFDLQAMQWRSIRADEQMAVFSQMDEPDRETYWRIDYNTLREGQTCTAERVERATQRVLAKRVLDQPCSLIDHRYVQFIDQGLLHWLDLNDPDSQWQVLNTNGSLGNTVWQTTGGPYLVLQRGVNTPSAPGQLTLQSIPVDLVRYPDQAVPQVVASWDVASAGSFYYSLDLGESIASINPLGTHIEFRSTIDGAILDTEPVPENVKLTATSWNEATKSVAFKTPQGYLNYDLRGRKWLEGPQQGRLATQSPDELVQVFRCPDSHCVWDSQQRRVLGEFPLTSEIRVLDSRALWKWIKVRWSCSATIAIEMENC